jgi:hypothetical protein
MKVETKEVKEAKQLLMQISKVEGNTRLHEAKLFLVPKSKMKMYFSVHNTTTRCMVVNNPVYSGLSIIFLNPLYMSVLYTNKYMLDIINYKDRLCERMC